MTTLRVTHPTQRLLRALAFARDELEQDLAGDWIQMCIAAANTGAAEHAELALESAESALEDLYAREHAVLLCEASALHIACVARPGPGQWRRARFLLGGASEPGAVRAAWEVWRHRARSAIATARSDDFEPPACLRTCLHHPPQAWAVGAALELAGEARALTGDPDSTAAWMRALYVAGQGDYATIEYATLDRRGWSGEVRDAQAFARELESLRVLLRAESTRRARRDEGGSGS